MIILLGNTPIVDFEPPQPPLKAQPTDPQTSAILYSLGPIFAIGQLRLDNFVWCFILMICLANEPFKKKAPPKLP